MPFALEGTCLLARIGSSALGNVVLVDSVCHCGRSTMAMFSERDSSGLHCKPSQTMDAGPEWTVADSTRRGQTLRNVSSDAGRQERKICQSVMAELETRGMACVCISSLLGLPWLAPSCARRGCSRSWLGDVRLPSLSEARPRRRHEGPMPLGAFGRAWNWGWLKVGVASGGGVGGDVGSRISVRTGTEKVSCWGKSSLVLSLRVAGALFLSLACVLVLVRLRVEPSTMPTSEAHATEVVVWSTVRLLV